MVAKLLIFAEKYSDYGPLVLLEWMRTPERQAQMVKEGKSKTMMSKHLVGLAVDACFLSDLLDDGQLNYDGEKYRKVGEYWESLGGKWGGRFGVYAEHYGTEVGWDPGHFEYKEEG